MNDRLGRLENRNGDNKLESQRIPGPIGVALKILWKGQVSTKGHYPTDEYVTRTENAA